MTRAELREAAWALGRQFFHERLVDGRARVVAAPTVRAVTRAQTAVARVLDGKRKMDARDDVTAVIKTFERHDCARRLVSSLQRLAPWLPIVVVDDSRIPTPIAGTLHVPMPWDSGVSAGRNEGLAHVATRYVLMLDDDFVLTRASRFDLAASVLDRTSVDLVAGRVLYLPFYLEQAPPIPIAGRFVAGLQVCRKVPNFWIARTDRVRSVGWDARLKRLDHADFFRRAEHRIVSVYDPSWSCLHARDFFDANYRRYRHDIAADLEYLEALRTRP